MVKVIHASYCKIINWLVSKKKIIMFCALHIFIEIQKLDMFNVVGIEENTLFGMPYLLNG